VKFAAFCSLCVVLGVAAELVAPGQAVYHTGWYNVLLAALLAALGLRMQRVLSLFDSGSARTGVALAAFGVAAIGFAGIVSGLLGPDAVTVVGAPGQRVAVTELGGTLDFPLREGAASVALVRGTRADPILTRRYTLSFLLLVVPRDVVFVQASDAHDRHLTITQPTGAAFLSPVLLMQQRQTIAGFDLPYDEFGVPAAHRIVHAVLFSAAQAAQLHGMTGPPAPAVLFDAEDETGASIPNGIGIARDGQSVTVAGLRLQPKVFSYPAVEVVSIPNLAAVTLGLLALVAGFVLGYRPR
jgi:hypothetical protein